MTLLTPLEFARRRRWRRAWSLGLTLASAGLWWLGKVSWCAGWTVTSAVADLLMVGMVVAVDRAWVRSKGGAP